FDRRRGGGQDDTEQDRSSSVLSSRVLICYHCGKIEGYIGNWREEGVKIEGYIGNWREKEGGKSDGFGGRFVRLTEGLFDLEQPFIHYKLDKTTGAISTSFSALAMAVEFLGHCSSRRGELSPVCTHLPAAEDSIFKQAKHLRWVGGVAALSLSGSVTCRMPPGRYLCIWRVSFRDCRGRGDCHHVRQLVALPEPRLHSWVKVGQRPVVKRRLQTGGRGRCGLPGRSPTATWSELRAGVIHIRAGAPPPDPNRAGGDSEHAPDVDTWMHTSVRFGLVSHEGGLVVDSFVLRSLSKEYDDDDDDDEEEEEEEEEEDDEEEEVEEEEEEEEGSER
ncbi:hypothetical protein CBR_g73920, partial [Chara braunii]